MATERDIIISELQEIVKSKKEEIAKAERPNWKTNCAFRFNKDLPSSTNLQVCSDVEDLTSMVAFLIEKSNSYDKACELLEVKSKFTWLGYTLNDWVSDIKTRITKIQITVKKKELEDYEYRLEKLVSPQAKEERELNELMKKIKGE
jgi:hypothetical protein